jgi:2-oxoglutarate dehydrogenase E2 component (dihydrolipoamide succinyltransferase)
MADGKIHDLRVPPLGESVAEATVARWAKNIGDHVRVDEILVELETDKVTLEVSSPATGILKAVNHSKGSTVHVGDVLGAVEGDDSVSATDISTAPEPAAAPVEQTPVAETIVVEKVAEAASVIYAPAPSDIPAPAAMPAPSPNTDNAPYKLSPAVEKWVGDNNLNPAEIQGTGKDGRITKADVISHMGQDRTSERLEERLPMSRLRLRIAERLKQAQNTAAILTTFNEIDMSTVNSLRAKYKDSFEKKYGVKLGYMSFFVKACVHALKKIPMMNSRIEGDEIVTCNYTDIGVAISAPQGLVVPVLRDADLLSFADVEKNVIAYGQKAKEGKLAIEDMTGGTFTITNGGTFGSLLSTPIINPPQSGILGMHKIQERPVVENGQIVIRPMMYVALSYDHRLIDGREAVTFLVTVKECLENPGLFLLDV